MIWEFYNGNGYSFYLNTFMFIGEDVLLPSKKKSRGTRVVFDSYGIWASSRGPVWMCEVRDVILMSNFHWNMHAFFVERFIYLNTAFSWRVPDKDQRP